MNRAEMVKARTEELYKLTDIQLVDMIISYFKQNATMPGEKAIKEYALSLKAEFDGNAITGLLTQVRGDLIEQFASMLVKEVKMRKVLIANETKKRMKEGGTLPLASDMPMYLVDSKPVDVPVNTMKNTYEMAVQVSDHDDLSCITESDPSYNLGVVLPKGFRKNHTTLAGMKAVVHATDHSNGKFANMSYRMLIDLGQSLAA